MKEREVVDLITEKQVEKQGSNGVIYSVVPSTAEIVNYLTTDEMQCSICLIESLLSQNEKHFRFWDYVIFSV